VNGSTTIGPVNLTIGEDMLSGCVALSFRPEPGSSGPGYPADLYDDVSVTGWEAVIGDFIEIWDGDDEGIFETFIELQSHWNADGIKQEFEMIPDSQLTFILAYKGRYDDYNFSGNVRNAFSIKVEGAEEVRINGAAAQPDAGALSHSFMDDDAPNADPPPYESWTFASVTIQAGPDASNSNGAVDITLSLVPNELTDDYGSEVTYGGFVQLLKMDVENLREEIITDAFEVSNKVTDQNLNASASSDPNLERDPRTYRVKLPVDLGTSAKIRFDLFDEDGATVNRRRQGENGELPISSKTENGETFYATNNFRFVTWDTDDTEASNQTINVKLGDTVRMNLMVDGNVLTFFELPIGLPPSEISSKAIRTVDTRFVKLNYGDVANQARPSTLIERMDKVFAQGAVRFDNVGEDTKAPVKNLITIKGNIDSGSVVIKIPSATPDANPEFIQVVIPAGDKDQFEVAQLIANQINEHYGENGEIRALSYSTYPNLIDDVGYEDDFFKYAHVVLNSGNEVSYNIELFPDDIGPGEISIPHSFLSSGRVMNLHDVALLGFNYGDGDPETMDIFIVDSITALMPQPRSGTTYGYALTHNEFSESPLVGSFFIILDVSKDDGFKPFVAPHEAGHILLDLDSPHSSFPTNLMHGQPYGTTSVSDSIQATKRIFDTALTSLRSVNNDAAGMLKNR